MKKVVLRRLNRKHTVSCETHTWTETLTAQARSGEDTPVVIHFDGAQWSSDEKWPLGVTVDIKLTTDETMRLLDVIRAGLRKKTRG